MWYSRQALLVTRRSLLYTVTYTRVQKRGELRFGAPDTAPLTGTLYSTHSIDSHSIHIQMCLMMTVS